MPEHKRPKYDKLGPAAILVSAYGVAVEPVTPVPPVDDDGVACVEIVGPLGHHASWGLDSYDDILVRVRAALDTSASRVLLKIDSPGGDVYGCFETARAIRAAADASGKALIAYVNGQAASAAYALACAADEIVVPRTGCVGSIGCIDMLASLARQDAAMGVDVAVITSGARKADGNPHVPLSEGALAAHQAHVDELAGVFFAWVAERRGLEVDAVRGFEAALFVGEKALAAGLVDQVQDFHELRGTLTANAPAVPRIQAMKKTYAEVKAMLESALAGGPQASKYTDAMAALAALAEEGDEDAKKAMKKMLSPAKAESDDKDGDEKKDDSKSAKAESDDGDKKDDKKDDGAKASAASNPVLALGAQVQSLAAKMAAKEEAEQRATLLASRPDFTTEVRKSLEGQPLENVKWAVANFPKVKASAAAAVQPEVRATRGEGQGDQSTAPRDGYSLDDLDVQMGLKPRASSIKLEGNTLKLGVMTPDQARAHIAAQKAAVR